MAETPAVIPKRAWFKAAEVCEIAAIQPYVLHSWELEFPNLGVARQPGAARVYRPADVEQVLRMKQLVFDEGLTLAGVRRRIEGDPGPEGEAPALEELVDKEVRARLANVKHGLRSLLQMLGGTEGQSGGHVSPEASRRGEMRATASATGGEPVLPFNGQAAESDVIVEPANPRRRRRAGTQRARRTEGPPSG